MMSRRVKLIIFVVCGILPQLLNGLTSESESEMIVLSRERRKVLFFPQYTTLQLSMCLIAQVSAITSHRLAVNHGFQINYQLPFNVSSYYSPIFWARKFTKSSSNLLVDFFERLSDSDDIAGGVANGMSVDEGGDSETTTLAEEEEDETTTHEPLERARRMIEPNLRDLSAGQFYSSIIETMGYAGYHEDCLLKSVCELAKVPLLHDKSAGEDVISEVLHFILTPSLHQAFDAERERDDKELYEEAENTGREGGDCELIYNECKVSPLHAISNFISIESHQ